jgi:hypothetical protein
MQLCIAGQLLKAGNRGGCGHKKTPEKYCLFIQYLAGVLKARI